MLAVEDFVEASPIDEVTLKGINRPIKITSSWRRSARSSRASSGEEVQAEPCPPGEEADRPERACPNGR